MKYDVHLSIKEETTGIGTKTNIRLEVYRAESGLYIASNPASPLVSASTTPRQAILEYLGDLFYNTTIEKENK